MDAYSEMLLGMLVVDLGFLDQATVDDFTAKRLESASIDKASLPPIGEALGEAGLLDAGQLAALTAVLTQLEQNEPDIALGRMLVAQRALTAAQVMAALRLQKQQPEPISLADLLVREGTVDASAIATAQTVVAAMAGGGAATAAAAPAAAAAAPAAPAPPAPAAPAPAAPSDANASSEQPIVGSAKDLDELLLAMMALDQGFAGEDTIKLALGGDAGTPLAERLTAAGIEAAQLDALGKLCRQLLKEDEDVVLARLAIEQHGLELGALEAAMIEQRRGAMMSSLGELLVEQGSLSQEQLGALEAQVDEELSASEAGLSFDDMLLGTLAVDQGVITEEQLGHAVQGRDPALPLWVQLLERGLLSDEKLASLNKLKSRLEQTDEDIIFSKVACDIGLVEVKVLEEIFREQKTASEHIAVGDLLLKNRVLTVKQKRDISQEVARRMEGATVTPASMQAAPTAEEAEAYKPQGKQFGRYDVLSEISRGGMGIIYKAVNTETGETVALKTLAAHLAINQEFVARFTSEAQALHKVAHPNIVGVKRVGHAGKVHYMEMEFVDGEDLRATCDREGPLPVDRAVGMLVPVLKALAHAWSVNVIHRDVKPENILIRKDGSPKLVDFGIAKNLEGDSQTRTGEFFGSPYYTAPEQLKHARSIDFRADIYALGACFYRMIIGEPPFGGDSAFQVIAKVLHEPILKRNELPVEIGKETYRVLETLMAKEPGDRPRSGAEVVKLMNSLLREVECSKCSASYQAFAVKCPGCGQLHKPQSGGASGRRGRGGTTGNQRRERGERGERGGAANSRLNRRRRRR